MDQVTASSVGFCLKPVSGFDDFAAHVEGLVKSGLEGEGPDLMVFPELVTLELIELVDGRSFSEKMAGLLRFTEDYIRLFRELAVREDLFLAAGSHLSEQHGRLFNTSYLFRPDGSFTRQPKCHLFPPEKAWTTPGDRISVVHMGDLRIALLICYDMEFPEVARRAALEGAEMLVSPSATLDLQGYWRVRHCSQARCIENQIYAVHCSLLGEAAGFSFTGCSSVLTPCDNGFPEKGVAVESPLSEEGAVTATLDLELLRENRRSGSAPTLKDLRTDMVEGLHRTVCRPEKGKP